MTTDLTPAIARELDAVVRSVEGVAAVFSSTPAVVNAVTQLALGPAATTLVAVRQVEDGLAIVASIGVHPDARAPAVAAAVAEAITERVGAAIPSTVTVRVSRVTPN